MAEIRIVLSPKALDHAPEQRPGKDKEEARDGSRRYLLAAAAESMNKHVLREGWKPEGPVSLRMQPTRGGGA